MIHRKRKIKLFIFLLIGHFVLIGVIVMKFYVEASEGAANAVVESSKAIHKFSKQINSNEPTNTDSLKLKEHKTDSLNKNNR